LERKISQAENKKAQLKAKIGALELAEDRWQGVLAREMNGYLRQNLLEFDYYGSGDLWEEPFRRAAILEKVRYVQDLSGFKRDVQKAAAEANQQKTQLQTKTAYAVAERRQREDLYRRKEEAYHESQQKVEKTLKDVQDLQDSAAALTQLVKTLERKSRGKSKTRVFLLAEAPHSLPWPAQGRVISSFGRQYVSELHTWVIHQGIRLATDAGAEIHPVQAGKVIFAGPFRSYGKVIIVDHGRDFYTIYGGLGRMLKAPGDRVDTSDALGTAELSGSGGTLYFEIRQSVDALDPLVWLRKR
jgi:septal ring factor EnvC (AmiA/AmiB activator)